MYVPDFTPNESGSYFMFEVLSVSILFYDDKILSLMVGEPSILEFCFCEGQLLLVSMCAPDFTGN